MRVASFISRHLRRGWCRVRRGIRRIEHQSLSFEKLLCFSVHCPWIALLYPVFRMIDSLSCIFTFLACYPVQVIWGQRLYEVAHYCCFWFVHFLCFLVHGFIFFARVSERLFLGREKEKTYVELGESVPNVRMRATISFLASEF